MSMSLENHLPVRCCHGAIMQVYYKKQPATVPEYSSAASFIASKSTRSTPLWLQKTDALTSSFMTLLCLPFMLEMMAVFTLGMLYWFWCHVINKCFIPCNNILQKLLSTTGIMRQTHKSKSCMMSFLIICEVLLTPSSLIFFCNPVTCMPCPAKCLALG
jgi:hypothetical protein